MAEVRAYKVTSLNGIKPNSIVALKVPNESKFELYISDLQGVPYPLNIPVPESSVTSITNPDGNLEISGSSVVVINVSPTLLNTINSALQAGDNISELVNDVGYLITESDPIFQASEASNFVTGDKSKLDSAIQPSDLGTVATSNDYNDLDNIPPTFTPSAHVHTEADITDLDKYTQLEVDTLLADKFDNPTGDNTQYLDGAGVPTTFPTVSGSTNLDYTTSPTQGVVTSDTGTDAIIPLADSTNAGLLSPSEKAEIASAVQPSVLTDFVPYTGANQDVDLGVNKLKADSLEVSTTPTETIDVGKIVWNASDGTFDMGLLNDVTLQAGQELYFYAKASENITNGDAVQFNGSQGDHLLIKKAVPSEINANPEYFIGVATQDFLNNEFGYVTVFGKVRNLNTTIYTNPVLYFDSENISNGKLKDSSPSAPNAKIIVAAVVRNHATQGVLMVRPHTMPKLESLQDLSDTSYSSIIDADSFLIKDSSNSIWKRLTFSNFKTWLDSYFSATKIRSILGITTLSGDNTGDNATNTTSNTYADSKVEDVINDGVIDKAPSQNAVYDALATKQDILTNPVTGTGVNGQVPFWNGINSQTGDNGLFWDNANKRLGVGTNAPRVNLHLSSNLGGQIYFTDSDSPSQNTHNINSANGAFQIGTRNNNGSFVDTFYQVITGANGASSQSFSTQGITRLLINNSGNIGIGTTNPQARLDVRAQGALSTDVAFRVRNSADTANLLSVNGVGQLTSLVDANISGISVGKGAGSGSGNTIIGTSTGASFTTGSNNSFYGGSAGVNNTTGSANTFMGLSSGQNNTTAIDNCYFGTASGFNNTGSQNAFFGRNSGRFIADGVTSNTNSNNSVFLGRDTRANANNQTNQIVIGDAAIGLGSNTVVLGNDTIVTTALKGNVGIGTTNPQARLDVRAQGALSTDIAFRVRNSTDTANLFSVAGNGAINIAVSAQIDTLTVLNTTRIGLVSAIAPSAQLDVQSTTKGFLPPRMTNAQRLAIASPAIGLIVYCTDVVEGLYINKSTGWQFII